MERNGLIHIYCGDGKGKTTASVGLTVRMAGDGGKVLFLQFFKNATSSELNVLKELKHVTLMHADGISKFYIHLNEEQKVDAKEAMQHMLEAAIGMADDYDLIVFDEIISAYNYDMIDHQVLIDFLKSKRPSLEVVLTGRDPAKELIDLADYVSEIHKVKHPYDHGINARRGIEF